MSNLLIISYDLSKPERNYSAIETAISKLGPAIKALNTFWIVRCTYAASAVADHLWNVMDADDSLFVADVNNRVANWYNLSKAKSDAIQKVWNG